MFNGPSSSAQRLREADHCELARAVCRRAAVTGLARDRRDIHDRALALLRQVRDTGLGAQERPLRIHRHHAVPRLFGEIAHRPDRDDPRVVHQDVDRAKFRDDLRRHPLEVGESRHVGENRNRFHAESLNLFDGAIQISLRAEIISERAIRGIPKIDQRDICSRRRQLQRDSAPDSPRRAGDDCVLALEFHAILSSTTAEDRGKRLTLTRTRSRP